MFLENVDPVNMPKQFHHCRQQAIRTVRRAGELARLLQHDDLDKWAKILEPMRLDIIRILSTFEQLEYRHSKMRDDVTCPVCSEVFDRGDTRGKYCSPKCRQKAYRDRFTKVRKEIPTEASLVTQERKEISDTT